MPFGTLPCVHGTGLLNRAIAAWLGPPFAHVFVVVEVVVVVFVEVVPVEVVAVAVRVVVLVWLVRVPVVVVVVVPVVVVVVVTLHPTKSPLLYSSKARFRRELAASQLDLIAKNLSRTQIESVAASEGPFVFPDKRVPTSCTAFTMASENALHPDVLSLPPSAEKERSWLALWAKGVIIPPSAPAEHSESIVLSKFIVASSLEARTSNPCRSAHMI